MLINADITLLSFALKPRIILDFLISQHYVMVIISIVSRTINEVYVAIEGDVMIAESALILIRLAGAVMDLSAELTCSTNNLHQNRCSLTASEVSLSTL